MPRPAQGICTTLLSTQEGTDLYAKSNAAVLNQYQVEKVMTASPLDLVVMLYDALIKNIKLAEIFLTDGNAGKSHKHLMKAQDIVSEFVRVLDLQFEMSDGLLKIYDFLLDQLAQINLSKDPAKIPALLEIICELREAWVNIQANTAGQSYSTDITEN